MRVPEIEDRRCAAVDHKHPSLSVVRQCRLLGISRSSLYSVLTMGSISYIIFCHEVVSAATEEQRELMLPR